MTSFFRNTAEIEKYFFPYLRFCLSNNKLVHMQEVIKIVNNFRFFIHYILQ